MHALEAKERERDQGDIRRHDDDDDGDDDYDGVDENGDYNSFS